MTRSASVVQVGDGSAVSEARRKASECAAALQMSATAAGKVALVATELATNLVKHAGSGLILLSADEERHRSLLMFSLDKADGIDSVPQAMQDGFSTAGSQGTGLGAVARSANLFDIYSLRGKGTAILCRIDDEEPRRAPSGIGPIAPHFEIAGLCVPYPGEIDAGDGWTATHGRDGSTTITLVDGLGHGSAAATAAVSAIRVIRERPPEYEIERLMHDAHAALRPTRGAALGIARIHNGRVDFTGVGNIAGTITLPDVPARKTVSHGGIVGHEMRKVQTFSYPWGERGVLVMQSDGISSSWNLASYPGLTDRHPALIAAVLYRDYVRGKDDATIVVVKAV